MRNILKTGQNMPRPILLCPGPVLLSRSVIKAVATTNIGHREPEFSKILEECEQLLNPIVGSDDSYSTSFITGSGTAANETVIANLGKAGPVLIVSNGEFGERLQSIADLHLHDVDHLKFDWQEKIDISAVENALAQKKYHMLAVVHHETSTGLLNPIQQLTELAHSNGAIILVDAISSIGAEQIFIKEWGIDVLVGASGKALSAMPGIGIIMINNAVLKALKDLPTSSQYLDLYKHFFYMRNYSQTPNTPAVHVLISLHASLQEINKLGVVSFQNTISQRANYARKQLTRLGLKYVNYYGDNSKVITCVILPKNLTFNYLAQRFKDTGIVVYNGKGTLTDKVFQIGHIGALRKNDTIFALKQLEKILRETARDSTPSFSNRDQVNEVAHVIS